MYKIVNNIIYYLDDQDRYHRRGGPAIIFPDGEEHYFIHGIRHRDGGPAIIHKNGYQYYQNDKLHRLDGLAYVDGNHQEYVQNDLNHRLDGPAIILADGTHEYWVEGKIPSSIMNIIITDRPMTMNGILIPEVNYHGRNLRAYRFDDPDEFILAQLHYA